MEANKVTFILRCEALSIDSVPNLLKTVAVALESEVDRGEQTYTDGDTVSWSTEYERVNF